MKNLEVELIAKSIDLVTELNSNKNFGDKIFVRDYLFNQFGERMYIHHRYKDGELGTVLKMKFNGKELFAYLIKGNDKRIRKYIEKFSRNNSVDLDLKLY